MRSILIREGEKRGEQLSKAINGLSSREQWEAQVEVLKMVAAAAIAGAGGDPVERGDVIDITEAVTGMERGRAILALAELMDDRTVWYSGDSDQLVLTMPAEPHKQVC